MDGFGLRNYLIRALFDLVGKQAKVFRDGEQSVSRQIFDTVVVENVAVETVKLAALTSKVPREMIAVGLDDAGLEREREVHWNLPNFFGVYLL